MVAADRIAHAPADLSSVDAAALVVAGSTALIALRDTVRLAEGERVLVRGAAGGVGTAAVQLAHAKGGKVTALARDRHAGLLTDLGADEILDYGSNASDQIGSFDVIVDTVGTELHCYRGRLAKNGRMVTASQADAGGRAGRPGCLRRSKRVKIRLRSLAAIPMPSS